MQLKKSLKSALQWKQKNVLQNSLKSNHSSHFYFFNILGPVWCGKRSAKLQQPLSFDSDYGLLLRVIWWIVLDLSPTILFLDEMKTQSTKLAAARIKRDGELFLTESHNGTEGVHFSFSLLKTFRSVFTFFWKVVKTLRPCHCISVFVALK